VTTYKEAKTAAKKLAMKYRDKSWWQGAAVISDDDSYYILVRVLQGYEQEKPPVRLNDVRVVYDILDGGPIMAKRCWFNLLILLAS
jgi:hypothetical protein